MTHNFSNFMAVYIIRNVMLRLCILLRVALENQNYKQFRVLMDMLLPDKKFYDTNLGHFKSTDKISYFVKMSWQEST
jgi:hypothetical protein